MALSRNLDAPKSDLPGSTAENRPLYFDALPQSRNQVDHLFPAEETIFPREKSVIDFFREQARIQPDALAVKDVDGSITYRELDRRSDKVARDLINRGLRLEEPVAVLIPASCEYVVAMAGILKAGGTYLTLDPDAPIKRLEFLLEDSASRFVLTNATGIKITQGWSGKALEVAQIIGRHDRAGHPSPRLSSNPHRRAYIIYTSGSTGRPKGVEIEHHSLTNLVCVYHERFNLGPSDRAMIFANVAFDASVADVWPLLCAGGSLIVPPSELRRQPDRLIAWMKDEQITWTFVPTGIAEILLTRTWPAQLALRFLVIGGDRLCVRPPPGLPFTVLNAYGPTENTVISTWSALEPQSDDLPLPPIGRALPNVKPYVLDEHRRPVAPGLTGELYLGGEQVARGYLGNSALTAKHFVRDPFTGRPGDRMYRTGDWVRWSPDLELEFLGRHDGQVQIRGNRVEIVEIEMALLAHPAVRQACCLPRLELGLATGIIAHIVPATPGDDLSGTLRSHLATLLPSYMLPSQFVFHDHLPLTRNGKVDRTALAIPSPAKREPPPFATSGDGLEIALSGLWHSLLPAAARFPKNATFSTLGGDSLLIIRLMLGVEEITNQRLEASAFLLQPTFPGLRQAVRTRMSRTEFQPVLTLRKHGTRPPLFFLYQYYGDIDVYFSLLEALGEDQPVYGIRSPALEDPSRLPSSIESAATEALGLIRKIQPQGAPALLGYSWAGLLAFEVARQLQQTERVSCFTALVGTDAPVGPANFAFTFTHFLKHLPSWLWYFATDGEYRWLRPSRWWNMTRGVGQKLAGTPPPLPGWIASPLGRHLITLTEKYHPPPKSNLTVHLFRERGPHRHPRAHPLNPGLTNHLPDAGWDRWTRQKPRSHWIEADHQTIIRPPMVDALAKSIRTAMDQHQIAPTHPYTPEE